MIFQTILPQKKIKFVKGTFLKPTQTIGGVYMVSLEFFQEPVFYVTVAELRLNVLWVGTSRGWLYCYRGWKLSDFDVGSLDLHKPDFRYCVSELPLCSLMRRLPQLRAYLPIQSARPVKSFVFNRGKVKVAALI